VANGISPAAHGRGAVNVERLIMMITMKSSALQRPAVVLTGNVGPARRSINEIALALTRSLGRHRVLVYRFHPDRTLVDLDSRYCKHVPCPNLYDDEAGLTATLVEFAKRQGVGPVIFPASDGAAEFIARNAEALRACYALACPSWSCISDIQNKQRLLERAREAGVPVPITHFPKSSRELAGIARTLPYPVVVKPLVSHQWKRSEVIAAIGSVKAVVVKNREELTAVYDKVAPLTPELMVQEIVSGETDRLLTFLGYVGRDGKTLAGCVRKKLRQFPAGFGYCCLTETVTDPEIMELSIRLVERLGFCGIVGVEFMRDARDGRPKLIEINARAVRTTGAAIGAGVDLPWIAYQDLASAVPPKPQFEYAVPMRWIHLRSEVRAALPLIWKGELRFTEWLRIFRGKTTMAVWAWDDLRPSLGDLLLPLNRRARSIWQRPSRPRAEQSSHAPRKEAA
jgi:predicted ATP-grasp superfamily ATP-dependent carboligase